MGEYLNGCINGVRDKHGNLNEEDAIHCYLALLTAVEANRVNEHGLTPPPKPTRLVAMRQRGGEETYQRSRQ